MFSIEERILSAQKLARSVVADGDIGLVVRYKGTQASATVEVASTTGDITFKHGALASEAVDDTIDSGGDDDGVIDVSDSNADTMGEVVDLINASSNWEAYLVDCLRADDSRTLLLTLSAAQAHKGIVPQGVRLYKDTSQNDNYDLSLAIRNRMFPDGFERTENKICEVNGVVAFDDYSSGTLRIKVYEIDPIRNTETLVATFAGGADDTEKLLDSTKINISSKPGNYLLVRLVNSQAIHNTAGYLTVLGRAY